MHLLSTNLHITVEIKKLCTTFVLMFVFELNLKDETEMNDGETEKMLLLDCCRKIVSRF